VEIEEEKLQLQNEKNRRMMEAEQDISKAKKSRVALNYRDRSYRSTDVAVPKAGKATAEKENIPKKAPIKVSECVDVKVGFSLSVSLHFNYSVYSKIWNH